MDFTDDRSTQVRTWRFLTVLLAALGLTMGAAHALELAPRMRWDAQLYTEVTRTLYRFYGIVGGLVQVGALLAAARLCRLVKTPRSFRLTLAGALGLAISLGLWAALVQPVNAEWARVLSTDPAAAPEAYVRLRSRWEYGHMAAFVAWLAGFVCLLLSVLAERGPKETIRHAAPQDAAAISVLVRSLAHWFTLRPDGEGAEEFFRSVAPAAIAACIAAPDFSYLVCHVGDRLAGVAAVRDRTHLYHLFVAAEHQGRHVGTRLWHRASEEARRAGNDRGFTVHSTPHAVPFYERLGFRATGPRVEANGIAFVPMALPPPG